MLEHLGVGVGQQAPHYGTTDETGTTGHQHRWWQACGGADIHSNTSGVDRKLGFCDPDQLLGAVLVVQERVVECVTPMRGARSSRCRAVE